MKNVTRRSFLIGTGLLIPAAIGGVALEEASTTTSAASGLGAAAILAQAAGHLSMQVVEDVASWLTNHGLDKAAGGTTPKPSTKVYQHPSEGTAAYNAQTVVYAQGTASLINFWTPSSQLLVFEPRAAQALSMAVSDLTSQVGFHAAAAALLPVTDRGDVGGAPGSAYRVTTFQAADGGLVQIAYDGRSGPPVETVNCFGHAYQRTFSVDPQRPFYLSQSSSPA